MQEDKDLRGASTMMPIKTLILWGFWHSRPPPTTIPSSKWSAQQWMGAGFGARQSCDPVSSPHGYRLSGIADTGDDSHVCDTPPGWHMRETQWTSLPGGEHFGTVGNPKHRSAAYFPHLSSSLRHLPRGLFLKPQSMKPPAGESLKLWLKSDFPGPLPQTYEIGISQEETQENHILNKLYQWAFSTKC